MRSHRYRERARLTRQAVNSAEYSSGETAPGPISPRLLLCPTPRWWVWGILCFASSQEKFRLIRLTRRPTQRFLRFGR